MFVSLHKLQLDNFKNCRNAELLLSDKLNCFVGDNGMGKTNLLDAIHYLSYTKSFFNLIDNQNILHDEDFFRISGVYLSGTGSSDSVECILKRNSRKIFKFNKKEYSRLADHIGKFSLVMISPADSGLVYEGSDLRRKYIDSVISQFDKVYLDDLIKYNKALQQRNKLLKQFSELRTFDNDALKIWDTHLIKTGTDIYEKRKDFIMKFAPFFTYYYEYISGGAEVVKIDYESQLHNNDPAFLLSDSVSEDRAAGYTTKGIHKDDLTFLIKDMPLKKFGSQGQQKSFLTAVKLAQFDYTKSVTSCKPMLLFDDIFDKLDDKRVEKILKLVSDSHFGQIFITDTSKERIVNTVQRTGSEHSIFEIINGQVFTLKD